MRLRKSLKLNNEGSESHIWKLDSSARRQPEIAQIEAEVGKSHIRLFQSPGTAKDFAKELFCK